VSSLVQLLVLLHDIDGDPIAVEPSSSSNDKLAFKTVPGYRKVPLGNQQRFGNNANQQWFSDKRFSLYKCTPMLGAHQSLRFKSALRRYE